MVPRFVCISFVEDTLLHCPPISIVGTNVFVAFCWVFFRATDFTTAANIIGGIIRWQNGIMQPFIWVFIALPLLWVATKLAIIYHRKRGVALKEGWVDGFYPVLKLTRFGHLVAFFIEIGVIAGLAYTGEKPVHLLSVLNTQNSLHKNTL